MKTRGAVLRQAPGKFEITDLIVDEPRQNEIRVKMVASGLCHSDDHMATGDLPVAVYPVCGGHEGAGIVESVGPNTPGFSPGDKVIFSFLPACGKCRWCSSGHQNLCDLGATCSSAHDGKTPPVSACNWRTVRRSGRHWEYRRFPNTQRWLLIQRSRCPMTLPWIKPVCSDVPSVPVGDRRCVPERSRPATPS